MDVVHNLGLEEGLGSVIHDLVAELGLGNVLSELLDASASSLLGTVEVNDLVSIVLGTSAIGQLGHQILDNLELSPEEGVLSWVHGVIVGLEEGGVHSRNSLNEALEAGGDLELLEKAGSDAASSGAREADLDSDNDGGVDGGA